MPASYFVVHDSHAFCGCNELASVVCVNLEPVLNVVLSADRYDGRGHLHDLSAYDASNIKDTEPTLTEDEMQMEKLCDDERYLELRTDIAEKTMYEGTFQIFGTEQYRI